MNTSIIPPDHFDASNHLDSAKEPKETVTLVPDFFAPCLPSNASHISGPGLAHGASSSSASSSSKRPNSISPHSMSGSNQRKSQLPALDEATPIINDSDESIRRNYQSTGRSGDGIPGEASDTTKSLGQDAAVDGNEGRASHSESVAGRIRHWFGRLTDKFGSLELENKGSVARDHLALERTFLAWLRTSLTFASIGIAVTQLFRLSGSSSSVSGVDSVESYPPLLSLPSFNDAGVAVFSKPSRLRGVGKPLGATFIGIAILILIVGFHRYFESQYWIVRGKFPASRGSVALIAFLAVALIITTLVVILTVSPGSEL